MNLRTNRIVALVGLGVLAGVSLSLGRGVESQNGVPSALLSHLTRGVNITRWFCYQSQYSNLDSYLKPQDWAAFKRLKLGFVRLCISPDFIYKDGDVDATALAAVDAGVDKLTRAGIDVIWDLHDNGQMKLDAPDHDNSGFISFWKKVADHYKGRYEDQIIFEFVNEPQFNKNPEVWDKLQEMTAKAVRAVDPNRTILASGIGWGGIEGLARMQPLDETNVVYSYHCYDPFIFTHQGATWTGDFQKAMKHIPFPSSPAAVAEMISLIPADYQGGVKDYGTQMWDEKKLQGRLEIAEKWAKDHNVPVVLGEFGSYPAEALPADRARWFTAMATAISNLHIRNSVWGYDDGMGLGRRFDSDGSFWLDPVTLKNLYGEQ